MDPMMTGPQVPFWLQFLQQKQAGAGDAAQPGLTSMQSGIVQTQQQQPQVAQQLQQFLTPSPAAMSPRQAAGPEGSGPTTHVTGLIGAAVNGIGEIVQKHKQHKFEEEAAQTSQVMTEIINSKVAQGKMQSGQQLAPDDIKAMAAQMNNQDPKKQQKIVKLLEKAQSDPMSGAYVGIQRAYQTAMEQNMAKAKLQADIDAKEAATKRADLLEIIAAQNAAYRNTQAQNQEKKINTDAASKHITVVGSDGKPHEMSLNPQTLKYDVDNGPTMSKHPIQDMQSQIVTAMDSGDTATAEKLHKDMGLLYKQNTKDKYINLLASGKPLSAEDKRFLKAYQEDIKQEKTDPGIARAAAYATMRPVQAVGDDGELHYFTAGEAEKRGLEAQGGFEFASRKAANTYFTSGKGGQQLNAIETAARHTKQLKSIVGALGNGNTKLANALAQQYAIQTGTGAAPLSFDAVKTVLAGEIEKTATNGVGDAKTREAFSTAMSKANTAESINAVLDNYSQLMDSKKETLGEWRADALKYSPKEATATPKKGTGSGVGNGTVPQTSTSGASETKTNNPFAKYGGVSIK